MEDFIEKVTTLVDRVIASADGEARQEEVAGRQEEADADAARSLAAKLNVDELSAQFAKHAGLDETLDREEFFEFAAASKLPKATADKLWALLDRDNSGTVSRAEFSRALRNMQQARAWLRYCPTCEFRNDCAYCHECNTDCTKCTESVFCASCWADHPARNAMAADDEDGDDEEGGQKKGSVHEFGSTEYFRTHLVLKPLDWAYNSPALAGLPVAYKAKLRQLLREQQMKQAEATEQALAMRADDAERNR